MTKTHIAVIHRHGARYVCKEAYHLLKDTDAGQGWSAENTGEMTKLGLSQCHNLGRFFGEHKLKGASDPEILWLSSEASRVIDSGRSFLQGFSESTSEDKFPKETFEKYINKGPENLKTKASSSRLIHNKNPHKLFRAFKTNSTYVEATKQYLESAHFQAKAEKEQEFLEEVFHLIIPDKADTLPLTRKLHLIDALVGAIECELHGDTQVLTNKFTESQIDRIYAIGRWIKDQLFFKLREAKTLGKPLVDEIIANSKKSRVSIYSAHDHTLCSVLSYLGVNDYPNGNSQFIGFGAYLVLKIKVSNKKVLDAEFNPAPFHHTKRLEVSTDEECHLAVRKSLAS